MLEEITGPRLTIKSYFTITVDGFYLTDHITYISFSAISKYLTKNIADIPDDLLFNNYEEAVRCRHIMFDRHNLVRRNSDIKIININKVEGIAYDR